MMPPHKVSLAVEGSQVDFEVDTGACKSLMSESMYHKFLGNVNLCKVRYRLNTISGENIKVVGEGMVQVKCKNKEVKLPLIIVESKNEFTPLLGRNWLDILFPNWQHGFKVNTVNSLDKSVIVEAFSREYSLVFEKNLCDPIRSFEVKFNVKDEAKPVVRKAYDMPYALKPKVEKKIKQMVQVGILKVVNYSEWASPIVVVPKKDGDVRICADFRTTVNKALNVDQYPLPKPEDIFASLAGGCIFTVLDLSGAYQQLKVSPEYQKYLTINTHLGMFQYTRLTYESKTFMLVVDSKSKWVDIHHMGKGTSLEPTIEKLKCTFSVMGLPDIIVSDNGPPFNSGEFTKFCHVNGIEVIKTPPYLPQSNGCVKDPLNKYLLSKSTLKIEQRIVNFLFSYRNTPTSCGMSPNEIIFKVKPKTRLDLLKPKKGAQIVVKESEEFIKPPMFTVGEKVFVGKLGPYSKEKWKTGEIVKCISAITYLVRVEDQIVYKYVNSLRKNRCLEQRSEIELRSPGIDSTPSIELSCNPNVTPEHGSSQAASPLLAESVNQRQANDVLLDAEVPCLRRSTRVRQAPKRLDL
nr:unnamed protein product [Callosobruchus analis]